jgi:hypothetical protein
VTWLEPVSASWRTWTADLGADGSSTHDQQAKKDALGNRPTVPEGGRGARGTGSPDPLMISTPRVYARVQLAETAMASACADGMPTLVNSRESVRVSIMAKAPGGCYRA